MTSNATTHALADENRSFGAMSLSRAIQCVSMRRDELRQSIRTFPAQAHVIVIKHFDFADVGQTTLPGLHP